MSVREQIPVKALTASSRSLAWTHARSSRRAPASGASTPASGIRHKPRVSTLREGIRNSVAITINPRDGELYVVQHGRDQLGGGGADWPKLFTAEQGAELPAEELFHVQRGDDFGWPYCYFDPQQKKKVLAPEYGGDGKEVGRCSTKKGDVAYFPAHWAPNGLLFYTGSLFPAHYRDGAFIAFHGSWN